MRIFLITIFSIFIFQFQVICQDTSRVLSPDQFLIELDIPNNWDVVRRLEGKDYTLSGYSPDDKFFVYYCQFMEDDESRPKRYLETYSSQFGLDAKKMEVNSKEIKGEKLKFYYLKDEADFLNERFNILFFATSVNDKNVIAYLIYPLNSNEETEERVRKIMLYGE
ncbi:MAG TPA: hypothetical protein VD908_14820 [Cytophagales bacterium]|nr:hypothetical protein [Cytophagales bacterium]